MNRQLQLHPHLTAVILACAGWAGATAYFLLSMPRQLIANDAYWLPIGASWATAFFAQCTVFLAVLCTVVVHALSGRWSWSVRLFAAVSAYWCLLFASLAVDSYENVKKPSGSVRNPAEFFEGAMTLAAIFLFYALFTVTTCVWIWCRGRRYRFVGAKSRASTERATNE